MIGTLKNLPKLLPEMKPLQLNACAPLALTPVPLPVCELIELINEDATTRGEWGEVDALMPTRKAEPAALVLKDNYDDYSALVDDMVADFIPVAPAQTRGAIALEAAVPGAGKTYLVKSWLDRTGQKDTAIICCPWNALVTQLIPGYHSSRAGWAPRC